MFRETSGVGTQLVTLTGTEAGHTKKSVTATSTTITCKAPVNTGRQAVCEERLAPGIQSLRELILVETR